jgi:uncharacterized protein (DUF58 family)
VRLFPTRSALDLAVAGAAVVLVGILLFQPAIVAWGGALIVALSVARAITLLEVARVRGAGFEMVWRSSARHLRIAKGQSVSIMAEVRNRDTRAARYVQLRVIGSPAVGIAIESGSGEVPAGGRLEVAVQLTGLRVGRYGLFGLALELRGGPGSFEVPLTFANPFGVEVTPAPSSGRQRRPLVRGVPVGHSSSKRSGEATEFSEIRDHQMGDSLKRVAWKASARRGKLLVRKYDIEEREVVWFVLDASVSLWAGRIGSAPLDLAVDAVSDLLRQHLRADHEVGLAVLANGSTVTVPAARGARHGQRLVEQLMAVASLLEPERSGLDEAAVAARVHEHLRALAPNESQGLQSKDLEGIARLASRALAQAPFPEQRVFAPAPREALLRTYLAVFGIGGPPKLEARSPSVDAAIGDMLLDLTRGRRRASLIYVVAPVPNEERWQVLRAPLRKAQRRRARLRWLHAPELPSLDLAGDVLGRTASTAARLRIDSERSLGELRLRQFGIPLSVCASTEEPPPDVRALAPMESMPG